MHKLIQYPENIIPLEDHFILKRFARMLIDHQKDWMALYALLMDVIDHTVAHPHFRIEHCRLMQTTWEYFQEAEHTESYWSSYQFICMDKIPYLKHWLSDRMLDTNDYRTLTISKILLALMEPSSDDRRIPVTTHPLAGHKTARAEYQTRLYGQLKQDGLLGPPELITDMFKIVDINRKK